jgi:hypothetical protein
LLKNVLAVVDESMEAFHRCFRARLFCFPLILLNFVARGVVLGGSILNYSAYAACYNQQVLYTIRPCSFASYFVVVVIIMATSSDKTVLCELGLGLKGTKDTQTDKILQITNGHHRIACTSP